MLLQLFQTGLVDGLGEDSLAAQVELEALRVALRTSELSRRLAGGRTAETECVCLFDRPPKC